MTRFGFASSFAKDSSAMASPFARRDPARGTAPEVRDAQLFVRALRGDRCVKFSLQRGPGCPGKKWEPMELKIG